MQKINHFEKLHPFQIKFNFRSYNWKKTVMRREYLTENRIKARSIDLQNCSLMLHFDQIDPAAEVIVCCMYTCAYVCALLTLSLITLTARSEHFILDEAFPTFCC